MGDQMNKEQQERKTRSGRPNLVFHHLEKWKMDGLIDMVDDDWTGKEGELERVVGWGIV
uniref:Uncharacterized protein n=1 Tax=Onchocerca volvulus TaxID=6282 RepID=A0A8R1XTE7_ONCVO